MSGIYNFDLAFKVKVCILGLQCVDQCSAGIPGNSLPDIVGDTKFSGSPRCETPRSNIDCRPFYFMIVLKYYNCRAKEICRISEYSGVYFKFPISKAYLYFELAFALVFLVSEREIAI